MNMNTPDCGWNPDARMRYAQVQENALSAESFDVSHMSNMSVTLTKALTIQKITGMQTGKQYTLLAQNTGSNAFDVTMPSGTLTNGTVAATAGCAIRIDFWTDGTKLYAIKTVLAVSSGGGD